MELVDDGKLFTLHAAWQTGETTSAQWLVEHYNAGERFRALWVDVETARERPEPASAFRTVLNDLDDAVERDLPALCVPPSRARLLEDPETAVLGYLRDLATRCSLPLVIFVDEADGLVGATMVSFLTQLRQGYLARRKTPFPHSVALIGRRTVRDYVLSQDERAPQVARHLVALQRLRRGGQAPPLHARRRGGAARAAHRDDRAALRARGRRARLPPLPGPAVPSPV
jgi:hypothetical protein